MPYAVSENCEEMHAQRIFWNGEQSFRRLPRPRFRTARPLTWEDSCPARRGRVQR
ncbi:hypothetical protein GCM10010517_22050 [Streptosporangium fragile]|uniref:Uncharacterized protein n=1 Tax=Streptosporangium fragile TaxID=46186 RepID=A0ABP6IDY4_9ACTN